MTAQGKNLSSLLHPNSIAITGASPDPEDLGSYILRNIVFSGYKGKVYPVSDRVSDLYDYKTYSSIKEIREDIDLAILSTPSDRVINDVLDCTKANVKNICITSKGYAESGTNGITLQKKIIHMADEAGINVLGPNSLGLISTTKSLNATFSPSLSIEGSDISSIPVGKAVFASQSGALVNALLEYSQFYSLGLSEVIGLGNKGGISELDLFDYYSTLRVDGQPYVMGCYLESIADGSRFLETAQKFCDKIPLVTLIPSESPKTREYIFSHSGSILQKDPVIDIALEQTGAIKVYTQQELYDLMLAFSWQVIPRGNNVAVISNAGGGLILAIEQMYRQGLKVVNFSTEVKKMLIEELDWKGQNAGVVDLGGQALSLSYLRALDIVLGDHDVNAVIVILSPQIMTQIEESAEAIGRLAKEHGKTIIAAFMGYEGVEKGIRALAKYYVPAFKTVDRAIFVLSKMYGYFRGRNSGRDIVSGSSYRKTIEKERSMKILKMIERSIIDRQVELNPLDRLELLKHYEIDSGETKKVKTSKEVLEFTAKNGYPVKFISNDIENGSIAYKKNEIKALTKKYLKKSSVKGVDESKACVVKKVYESKKKFKVRIVKDTYYDHSDKGLMMKDLKKLSFGYYFTLNSDHVKLEKAVKGLLPISGSMIKTNIKEVKLPESLGLKPGPKYDEFLNIIVKFINKVSSIPLDFRQVLMIELDFLIHENRFIVYNSMIKLDLIS